MNQINNNDQTIKKHYFKKNIFKRNDSKRQEQLQKYINKDVKVRISDSTKDFSRMKHIVDTSPEIDNSSKITHIKKQIKNGTYDINHDKIAESILNYEL